MEVATLHQQESLKDKIVNLLTTEWPQSANDIYKSVKIPIIGTGGITNGEDGIEMMMAGASFISVGSAVYWRGPKVFSEIEKEMENWMKENGCKDLKKIVGVAHEVRDHKSDIY